MTTAKPPIERRLAAILAADIAGYSALMGADEETTVSDLKGHQSVILPMVSEFGGRVVDTAGDGILAEFPSVLNAVRCAVEIQHSGRFSGGNGQGNYQVRGGTCVGLTEIRRMTSAPPAAAPLPPSSATGPQTFDGTWRVILTGGANCPVKSNTWQMQVANSIITPSRPDPGRVETDGRFRFAIPAKVDANTIVHYRGKLTGDSGHGEYEGGGGCVGTLELKRLQ